MPSVSSIAAQSLQRRITTGEFPLGSALPSQRELADSLGISRASLREAISTLEALGLVRSQAGKGVYVTKGSQPDPKHLPQGPSAISPEALFEFRYALEPAWTALATRRITPEQRVALETSHLAMEKALHAGDLVTASEQDLQFHLQLASLSGNPALASVADQFNSQIAHSLRLPFANATNIWAPADEHRAILSEIAAGDSAAAARAMRAHLSAAAARVGIVFIKPE